MKSYRLLLVLMLIASPVFAGGEHPTEPYIGSEAFEKMKALEGNWEGVFIEGGASTGAEQPAKLSYEVSSGGTALIEKLGAGTPTEMVSIYNDEKGGLVMTHYCLMRNQPKLKLVSSDADHLQLEMKEAANGVELKDNHMHALKITFVGKDEIVQEWRGYMNGELIEKPTIVKLKKI